LAKSWLGLERSRFVDVEKISSEVGAPESEALAGKISEASVTLLRNHGNLLPISAKSRLQIVIVTEAPNLEAGRELEQVLQPHIAAVSLSRLSNESSREFIQQVVARFQEADVILFGIYLAIGSWKGQAVFRPLCKSFLRVWTNCPSRLSPLPSVILMCSRSSLQLMS
jgi:beta-glucosidase-like glycosyl hydrolase